MSTLAPRRPRWSDVAIAHLEDSLSCPRCDAGLDGRRCHRCGADYSGPIGGELWDASLAAVEALRTRQDVLDRVPTRTTDAATPAPAPVAVPRTDRAAPRSSATVQSVLAVAGAGLVAVAAIVFTFLNPDVTDPLARGLIVGAVTLVFIAGAAVLQRRRLRFSAEAVGALGVVFVGLDVRAVAVAFVGSEWFAAAIATLVAAAALTGLALALRLRTWLWSGVVALTLVPGMLGLAADAPLLGSLGVAVTAFALLLLTDAFAGRIGTTLNTERATLTVVQVTAIVLAVAQPVLFGGLPPERLPAGVCGVLAASAVLSVLSTRHPGRRMWSFFGGGFGTAAIAMLPLTLGLPAGVWWWTAVPAAAVLGAVTVAALAPMPRTIEPGSLAGGAILVVALIAAPPTLAAIALGASAVLRGDLYVTDDGGFSIAVAAGLGALAVGLVAFGMLRERLRPSEPREAVPAPDAVTADPRALPAPVGMRWVADLGVWYAGIAALAVLTIPMIAVWGRVALGLGAGQLVIAAVTLLASRRPGRVLRRTAVRIPLIVTAHLLVLFAAILSWRDLDLAVWAGAAVVVAVGALATTVPASARFGHVGAGYAYALVVFATGLSLARLDDVAILCLTTSAGAIVAITATFARRVRVRDWYAVLAVTSVPFLLGVGQVVFVRSGWTALSTSLIFALALALVVTRRAGLVLPLRLAAAGVLVPALAVVIVCLGAQLLAASGSPVVLPVIAVLVAVVLPSGPLVRAALAPRIGEREARLVRIAIEATTLLTAAIAVGLALVREAAGLGTSLVVLAVIGVAGVVTALWGDRRYGWWLAGAAFTGALWCAWGLAGVELLEAYLLPPAIAAAVVGGILTGTGRPARELYAAGLGSAIVPLVAVTAVAGPPARALALVAAAWVLAAAGAFLRGRLAALRTVTLSAAIVAAAAGVVLAARLGLGIDAVPTGIPLIVTCAALAVVSAGAAAVAARTLLGAGDAERRSRWLTAPAFAYLAVGAWTGIERDWLAIWSMWTLLLVLLATVVVAAWRGVRRSTSLPPVWFLFGLAFATAVVAWSPRDLRVEWFSLPMGVALLAAGWIALRTPDQTDGDVRGIRSLSAWPAGFAGSWALLTPGLVVLLSASIAATFTDPLTWRAILVIVLALLAILVGASRRLAAPFVIGIVVLPVENALAFLVQIGRGIEAMPWWITLAVVGAVLLIIAVTYERRAGEGIAARLRDLA